MIYVKETDRNLVDDRRPKTPFTKDRARVRGGVGVITNNDDTLVGEGIVAAQEVWKADRAEVHGAILQLEGGDNGAAINTSGRKGVLVCGCRTAGHQGTVALAGPRTSDSLVFSRVATKLVVGKAPIFFNPNLIATVSPGSIIPPVIGPLSEISFTPAGTMTGVGGWTSNSIDLELLVEVRSGTVDMTVGAISEVSRQAGFDGDVHGRGGLEGHSSQGADHRVAGGSTRTFRAARGDEAHAWRQGIGHGDIPRGVGA